MLNDNHHLTESADEVLDKAEAFLRSRRLGVLPPSDDDVPVLTDIVPETEAFVETPATPEAAPPMPEEARVPAEPEIPEDREAIAPPPEALTPAQPFVPEEWPEAAFLPEPAGLDQLEFELPEEAEDIPVLQEVVAAPEPAVPAHGGEKPDAPGEAPEATLVPPPESSAPPALPAPGLSEEAVAARVAEALARQRQVTTLLLEEWLNFDLKTIIQQEFEHANERIVRRSLQEIHALLDAQLDKR